MDYGVTLKAKNHELNVLLKITKSNQLSLLLKIKSSELELYIKQYIHTFYTFFIR